MRILVITDRLPYPLSSGDDVRKYNLLKRVAARHEVWLMATPMTSNVGVDEAIAHLSTFCKSVEVVIRQHQSSLSHVPGLVSYALQGIPLETKFMYSPAFAEAIRRTAEAVDFDLVNVIHTEMARYVEALPPNPRRKHVLTMYDVTFQRDLRASRVAGGRVRRMRLRVNSMMMRRWEPRYAGRFDRVITVSEADRQTLLAANPRLKIEVVQNGVDTQTLQPLADTADPAILFVGSMGYLPNTDGVLWFHEAIWPLIRRDAPAAHLWVVGSGPPPAVEALANEYVTVTGRVPDVAPYYQQAAVTVVPLRTGGGTRLKILESMALGRAVVSTTVGAEGLGAIDGEHLYIADTPAAFAARTVDLLHDPAARQRMAAAARQFVAANYDWDPIAGKLLAIYDELVPPEGAA